ncbi:LWR-salt protein [Halospeciosus flavus]|uniref:LWR-salt protein n=1 Tax=Halospeciosus flavus TaxID=3032283 RepID=A0ABD5Z8P0_9EURY|nr:LWR-salt protein [Halospeciosus flavus]
MDARYVFTVRFRLEPSTDVELDPDEFETRLTRPADDPGEEGWLFFRDNLWRGELADEAYFRQLAEDALDVTVLAVDYRSLDADEAYYEALQEEIAENLDLFKADSTTEVLNKYLGSSVELRD